MCAGCNVESRLCDPNPIKQPRSADLRTQALRRRWPSCFMWFQPRQLSPCSLQLFLSASAAQAAESASALPEAAVVCERLTLSRAGVLAAFHARATSRCRCIDFAFELGWPLADALLSRLHASFLLLFAKVPAHGLTPIFLFSRGHAS
jgi:hypothetical protein